MNKVALKHMEVTEVQDTCLRFAPSRKTRAVRKTRPTVHLEELKIEGTETSEEMRYALQRRLEWNRSKCRERAWSTREWGERSELC